MTTKRTKITYRTWYLVDVRTGILGAASVALLTYLGRLIIGLPVWALALIAAAAIVIALLLVRPKRIRQRRLATILGDASASSAAFRLIAYIRDCLQAGHPSEGILEDINLITRRRHYPAVLLARPFMSVMQQEVLDTDRRHEMIRWADAILRERERARAEVAENIAEYLSGSRMRSDLIVLYGYSSTVCSGLIRHANRDSIIFVIEDLQYGYASINEHELVRHALTSNGLSCHIIRFDALGDLFNPAVTSVKTLDDHRLSLPPHRTLLGILGCDAISVQGEVLIPAVISGVPSDSACLAEAFLPVSDGTESQIARRLVICGESFKVADPAEILDAGTSAPERSSSWLNLLHDLGIPVHGRSTFVSMYRIGYGVSAIITDTGIHWPDNDGKFNLELTRRYWFRRIGMKDLPQLAAGVRRSPTTEEQSPDMKWPQQVGAVIFDWNGVLVLDEPLHFTAFAQVCSRTAEHQLTFDEYSRCCFGVTDAEGFRNLLRIGAVRGDVSQMVSDKYDHYMQAVNDAGSIAAPGAAELLSELRKAGVPYHLVTASSQHALRTIRDKISMKELLPDDLVVTDVDSTSRYLVLSNIVRRLDSDLITLLVDDREDNILMGSRLGMLTARVDPQPGSCVTAADFCIKSVRDLKTFVRFGASGTA